MLVLVPRVTAASAYDSGGAWKRHILVVQGQWQFDGRVVCSADGTVNGEQINRCNVRMNVHSTPMIY